MTILMLAPITRAFLKAAISSAPPRTCSLEFSRRIADEAAPFVKYLYKYAMQPEN